MYIKKDCCIIAIKYIKMTLGQQIMIARKDQQLTQKELCNKVGISLNSLSRFERGLSNPKISTLRNIAKELGVSFNVR